LIGRFLIKWYLYRTSATISITSKIKINITNPTHPNKKRIKKIEIKTNYMERFFWTNFVYSIANLMICGISLPLNAWEINLGISKKYHENQNTANHNIQKLLYLSNTRNNIRLNRVFSIEFRIMSITSQFLYTVHQNS
jgi:hypothetical protein